MPFDLSIFQEALTSFEKERENSFTSLPGASGALLVSLLRDPCLLLCPTETSAVEFFTDAAFWSGQLNAEPPVFIPAEDHPLRSKGLTLLYSSTMGKFVSSVEASLSPLWAKEDFPLLSITKGLSMGRDNMIENLRKLGYYHAPLVSAAGEMSSRGGIFDVFPPDGEYPVRIEFFGDEIESIRFFDIETQLSVKETNDIQICPAVEPEEGTSLLELLSDRTLIISEPDEMKRRFPDFEQSIEDRKCLHLTSLRLEGEGHTMDVRSVAGLGLLPKERKSVEEFIKKVIALRTQYFIQIVSSSEGQAKRLKELFYDQDSDVPIVRGGRVFKESRSPVITIGELSRGFSVHETIVLTGKDIFGERPTYKPGKKSKVSHLISSIEDFKQGDYLVHLEHGIGRFLGITKERVEDFEGDFITIEYLGGDHLFVPLERINYVQKYNAPEGVKAKVDRLGGKTWQKTKQRVRQKIKDMAEKLLKVYAKRKAVSGYAFSDSTELHREFDGFFPYEATPDQLTSVNEINRDMEDPTPMDRLLCGDVGYGKTEVVMRACFKAVYDSRQVAVLVPTTILAEQHYETFTSRFAAFPIRIDFLSRFKSRVERKKTLTSLSEGAIDIIIGTHSLLGKDVRFYKLGLLVIDEEHKFGVTHKEKIKALKSNVDVLTLSATPIPRTLHMALSGVRGMSTIETPPEDRLAVKSAVARFSPVIIREALIKELDRDGQAFFVHNRVKDIYHIADFLKTLVPEGKIRVAHGQMKEKELESVMRAFFHGEINVLVSTSIIGSGLDIPTANTIIINRADMFGLADLYQLRGRVGRSNIKAYAYFLIPGEDIITEIARKKLEAIQELGYLGAGFRLALKDLEIRGAGNMLGAEQSGHIEAVGFEMYMEMLEAAVAELKGEKVPLKIEPVIALQTNAIIPEEYIEDPDIRLSIYRKAASLKDITSLEKLNGELKDRFGPMPEKTKQLLEIMELKVLAAELAITRLENIAGKVSILFAPETPVSPDRIFSLHETRKGRIRFLPEGGLELDLRGNKWGDVYMELGAIMKELKPAEVT